MSALDDIAPIRGLFEIEGDVIAAEPHGRGHINRTYAATYNRAGQPVRYIHQRINTQVFRDPVRLMDNIEQVTRHVRARLEADGANDLDRRCLRLIPARDGRSYARDAEGHYWRTYLFVENTLSLDAPEHPRQTYEAGRAFGRFQQWLADLPASGIHETIPFFHHTPRRFEALERAIANDAAGRVAEARAEIEFALARRATAGTLVNLLDSGAMPLRITHNDTKLNNVLLDACTGEGICVIDLDTIMPGSALYDFGDMVRTGVCLAREDERDLDRIVVDRPLFESLTRGYLSAARDFLTNVEREHLVFSGQLITLEIGVRFLTDHLEGDTYFRIHRPNHNLDRCRTQFRLVQRLEECADDLHAIVEENWRNPRP